MTKTQERLAYAIKAMVSQTEGTPESPDWLAIPSDVFHEVINAYFATRHIKEVPNLSKLIKEKTYEV